MNYIPLYIVSLFISIIGTWYVLCWGEKYGFTDLATKRSSHQGTVPKGGGIGILAAFIFVSLILKMPLLIWGSIALVSMLSLYGDKNNLSPKFRLLVHFIAGIGILIGVYFGVEKPNFSYFSLFYLFYIVGTANYYNFMDGINGIAGITGIVAFGLIILFLFITKSNTILFPLAGCMVLSCLGFLPFNLPKASVFMGDVGSILLGFIYALFVVALSHSLSDFLVLCAFLFPFYADELTTMIVRLKNGDNLMQPHRKHMYQLLANEMGIAHWKISTGYGILQLLVGVSMLIIMQRGIVFLISLIFVYFVGFLFFSIFIRKRVGFLCNS